MNMNISMSKLTYTFIVMSVFFLGIFLGIISESNRAMRAKGITGTNPRGKITEASWYSRLECMTKMNPDAMMANGQPLDDNKLTCAHWKYAFGVYLKVTHANNGNSVVVKVTDRGPSKQLVKEGRTIDLTREAFSRLDSLNVGIIPVFVEVVE